MSCVGFERSLFDCSLTLGDEQGTCSHGMDVGIECSKLLRREGSQRSNCDCLGKGRSVKLGEHNTSALIIVSAL